MVHQNQNPLYRVPDPDPPLTPPALIPVELGILFTTVFFWFILAEACGPVRGCMVLVRGLLAPTVNKYYHLYLSRVIEDRSM